MGRCDPEHTMCALSGGISGTVRQALHQGACINDLEKQPKRRASSDIVPAYTHIHVEIRTVLHNKITNSSMSSRTSDYSHLWTMLVSPFFPWLGIA